MLSSRHIFIGTPMDQKIVIFPQYDIKRNTTLLNTVSIIFLKKTWLLQKNLHTINIILIKHSPLFIFQLIFQAFNNSSL